MEQDKEFLKSIEEQFARLQKMYDMNVEDIPQSSFGGFTQQELDEMNDEFYLLSKTKVLNFKKVSKDAVLPSYNYPSDSGFDLYSTEEVTISPFGRALIPTGLVVQFDEGLELQVRPKSGLAINQGLTVLNTPGTVDQGYTGEIQVIVFNTNNHNVTVTKGMKIAQGVLCPVINGKFVRIGEIDNLENRDRGNKGFGSTGI